jgi:hypothetical protein
MPAGGVGLPAADGVGPPEWHSFAAVCANCAVVHSSKIFKLNNFIRIYFATQFRPINRWWAGEALIVHWVAPTEGPREPPAQLR